MMAVGWGNLLAFAAFVVGSLGASDEKKVNKVVCYHSRSGEQSIYDHVIRVSRMLEAPFQHLEGKIAPF